MSGRGIPTFSAFESTYVQAALVTVKGRAVSESSDQTGDNQCSEAQAK
jgi:hypothetical protein